MLGTIFHFVDGSFISHTITNVMALQSYFGTMFLSTAWIPYKVFNSQLWSINNNNNNNNQTIIQSGKLSKLRLNIVFENQIIIEFFIQHLMLGLYTQYTQQINR